MGKFMQLGGGGQVPCLQAGDFPVQAVQGGFRYDVVHSVIGRLRRRLARLSISCVTLFQWGSGTRCGFTHHSWPGESLPLASPAENPGPSGQKRRKIFNCPPSSPRAPGAENSPSIRFIFTLFFFFFFSS
jgi:hypothetical protein